MIKSIFDRYAETYDRARRQLVPCFDEFYGAVLNEIPYERSAALRILDLGAGTGLLSMFVSKQFPNAKVTLVDASGEMLKKAHDRFSGEAHRFEFVLADYAEVPLPGPYDAVVSALSIHHQTDEKKAALFRKIFGALAGGGVFINADEVLGATPEIERRYRDAWLRQIRERKVSDEDLAASFERMKEHRLATLEAQLTWIKEAGFEYVDCWYKNYSFVVFGGYKPNGG